MQSGQHTSSSSLLKCKRCKSFFVSVVEYAKHKEPGQACGTKIETKKNEGLKKPSSKNVALVIAKLKRQVAKLEREKRDLKALLDASKEKKATPETNDPFFLSDSWKRLRYRAMTVYPRQCMACGLERTRLHVDHIKPRSKYPELALEFSNLQILCEDCNLGKSNWDETDWRPHAQVKGKL